MRKVTATLAFLAVFTWVLNVSASSLSETSPFYHYSESEVAKMKRHLPDLRLGMTMEKCLHTLGLDLKRTIIGDSQQSPTRAKVWLYPAEGHMVIILLDLTKGEPSLLAVRIDDEVWPPGTPATKDKEPNHPPPPTSPSRGGSL